MNPRLFLLLLAPVLTGGILADELTLEPKPFDVVSTFEARVMPEDECVPIHITPESWSDFEITRLAPHGAKVAMGDVLVGFETEAIDRWLDDTRRSITAKTLALAKAERELAVLKDTAAPRLDVLRHAATVAREENEYFKTVRRKAEEEGADQGLKRSQRMLDNETEELVQLQRMYEEDDLTEETEEIILTRQKGDVEAAEFALRMQQLNHQRTREVLLPREAVRLADAERDTAVQLGNQEKEIPETIESSGIEIDTLKAGLERERDALAKVEKDRALFEIKAPADGWFHHGAVENGRWTTGDLIKTLVVHGKPTLNRPVATFVPATAKPALVAFVDEAAARSLAPGLAGVANFPGRGDLPVAVKVAAVAAAPETDATWRTGLTATWPDGFATPLGSSATVRVVTYQKPDALVVPTKALAFGAAGWTVEVKLADGKTQRRAVTTGRSNGTDTEITAGLEAGQVVVVVP